MFERFCALLLRIYPAGFRREYGHEAGQLVRDRARDERGAFRRARLLLDLCRDLFATWFRGWEPRTPPLAQVADAPRFDLIDVHRPRPAALGAGILASTCLFAACALLFQSRALTEAPAPPGKASTSETSADDGGASVQPVASSSPDSPHELIASVAATLQQFYDRAIGQQLAAALMASERNGAYKSLGLGAPLAARINDTLHATSRILGIPPGTFVADVVYSARPLPMGPPPPITPDTASVGARRYSSRTVCSRPSRRCRATSAI